MRRNRTPIGNIHECRVESKYFAHIVDNIKRVECVVHNKQTEGYEVGHQMLFTTLGQTDEVSALKLIVGLRGYKDLRSCFIIEGLRYITPLIFDLDEAVAEYERFLPEGEILAIELGDCEECVNADKGDQQNGDRQHKDRGDRQHKDRGDRQHKGR